MFSKVLIKKNITKILKTIKTPMPTGKYLTYAALSFAIFMSSIITTNRKSTITAPTYTRIKIIDKNSAPNNNHSTAEKKNEKTKFTADNTGFEDVITFKAVKISKALKMKKVTSSMFITYFFPCPSVPLVHTCHLF